MANFIIIVVLLLIVGVAVTYIVKAKKGGAKCIGCPSGGSCSAQKGSHESCNCGCHSTKK